MPLSSPWLAALLLAGLALPACGDDSNSNTTPDAMSPPDGMAPPDSAAPAGVLERTLDAIGGAEALRELARLEITSQGQRFEYAQGYRPEDPPISFGTFTLRSRIDVEHDRMRLDWKRDISLGGVDFLADYSEVIAGDIGMATGCDSFFGFCTQELLSQRVAAARKLVRLTSPHLLLRQALVSPETVSAGAPRIIDGQAHSTLIIQDEWQPVELAVNDEGEIVLAATREVDHALGDVDIQVAYADWASASGGSLRFPRSLSLSLNGTVLHVESGRNVTVGAAFAADLFDDADDAQQPVVAANYEWGLYHAQWLHRWLAIGIPLDYTAEFVQEAELVPDSGVYLLGGAAHNTLAVELDDSIVLVEAPYHERRSNGILAKVAALWPDKPVTHVILTHFHDDHTGGVRTLLAQGATLVVSEHGRDHFTRVIESSHTLVPDALAQAGITPPIETVGAPEPFRLGTAERGIEVWPVETTHSIDMVIVYVPHAKLVFNSDLYTPDPTALERPLAGDFAVFASELNAAIQSTGIDVEIVAGGHGATVTYEQMQQHLTLGQ